MAAKTLLIVQSQSLDAHHNQSVEAALLSHAGKDTVILYIWANEHAVFVGKNQNAHLECNLDLLQKEGGTLARRITGGGAVYHDKGNVNYTFIASRDIYDEKRQFGIVLSAIRSLGFDAVINGRNDITIDGRKFSGNAFFKDQRVGLHHGTILIQSNPQLMARYLSASRLKLKAKGVESVASRVVNLNEIKPEITKNEVISALIESTKEEYGIESTAFGVEQIDPQNYTKWHDFFTDSKRLLGDNVVFDAQIEHRFDWGTADIRLKLEGSRIVAARVYTDSLDPEQAAKKEAALLGEDIYNTKNGEAEEIIAVHRGNYGL